MKRYSIQVYDVVGEVIVKVDNKLLSYSTTCDSGMIKFDVMRCGDEQNFKELEYLLLALISAVPSFAIPMFFVGKVISLTTCFYNRLPEFL